MQQMKLNLDYSICTLPRVGSFYLQDRILQHTGHFIKKYHSHKDNKMITIVRDPRDMLTSKLAMSVFYDKNNETINDIRSNKITKDLEQYIDFVNRANKDFYILINYNDLVSCPTETTMAAAEIMDLPIISKEYKDNLKDYPEYSHLSSSKKVNEYEEIKDYVEKLDLSYLYTAYNRAIKACIKPLF